MMTLRAIIYVRGENDQTEVAIDVVKILLESGVDTIIRYVESAYAVKIEKCIVID